MISSWTILVRYHNHIIDIDTIHQSYLDVPNSTCTHIYIYVCTYFCEIKYKFMNQPPQSKYTILLGEQGFLVLSYYNQEHLLSCPLTLYHGNH